MRIGNIIRGISGEPELTRAIGAIGALAYIVTGAGLAIFEVVVRGVRFDIVAFCTAFPGGLGLAVGAIAGAVALKDRHVATARVIAETGGLPPREPASSVSPAPTPSRPADRAEPADGAPDLSMRV